MYHIPILTLAQKQHLWRKGQQDWQLTEAQIDENIARNVIEVMLHQSGWRGHHHAVQIHWEAGLPVSLLLAVVRHLQRHQISHHILTRIHHSSFPPVLRPLVRKTALPVEQERRFSLQFIFEEQMLSGVAWSSLSSGTIKQGVLIVLPGNRMGGTAVHPQPLLCSSVLLPDFPTSELMEQLVNLPTVSTFLGWTGIPYELVQQIGQLEGVTGEMPNVIKLGIPAGRWPGGRCQGIVLD